MFAPPMHVSCRVYDQGGAAHPDLDDRDLQTCLRARLAEQRRRVARQRRRERRRREEEEEAAAATTALQGEGHEAGSSGEEENDGEGEGKDLLFVFAPAHAGWLIKRGSGGLRIWRRRWVRLDANRCLWYGSGPWGERSGAEGALGRMELTQWSRVIEEVPGGDPLAFRVVPGGPEDEERAVVEGIEGEGGEGGATAAANVEPPSSSSWSQQEEEDDEDEEEEEEVRMAGKQQQQQEEQEQEQQRGWPSPAPSSVASASPASTPSPEHPHQQKVGEEGRPRHHRRGSSGGGGGKGPRPGPGPAAAPAEGWLFRAESPQEKAAWVARLRECVALAGWWGALRFGPALGEGGFGAVHEMLDMRRGERLAVKVMEARSRMERDQALAETEILAAVAREIRHPHLMAPRRVYVEGNRAWLMFPLCRGGDLFHRLTHHARGGPLPEPAAATLLYRLLGAVAALHRHGVLHLDVKPENVLFASEDADPRHVLLTDFGLSRRMHHGPLLTTTTATAAAASRSSSSGGTGGRARGLSVGSEDGDAGDEEEEEDGAGCFLPLERERDYLARLRYSMTFDGRLNGTIGYMSPEVVLHKRYGPAADVWSLGVVLHILLLGRSPWHGPHPDDAPDAPDPDDDDSAQGDGDGDEDPHRAVLARSVRGLYATEGPGWAGVSEGAKDLLARMLAVDDAKRITTAEALAHPWLARAAAEAKAEAEAMTASGAGRPKPFKTVGAAGQKQRRGQRKGAGDDDDAGGAATWVHTPSTEGSGALRSLLDGVWSRGSSFLASFTAQGSNSSSGSTAANGSGSGSRTDTTYSLSSSSTSS